MKQDPYPPPTHETTMTKPSSRALHEDYDRLPYTSHAYAETHPERLRVVARLSGWNASDLGRARVLEIGCGRGGNLLAMAMSLPEANLVGVEPSVRQAAEARTIATRLGVKNVTVHTAGFEDEGLLEGADGGFDFVLAHGVASWIPIRSRAELLSRVSRWLSPSGVAYVSFNVLPGWYARLAARDWMRFRAAEPGSGKQSEDPVAALVWLRGVVSPELAGYKGDLARVEERLRETDPAYLAHEYLAGENHPARVADLLREAEDAGLSYLGDAVPRAVTIETLPESAQVAAEKLEKRDAQQLIDFVRFTAFRRALFVRADTAATRGWRWPARLDAEAIRTLFIASRLVQSKNDPERFDGSDVSVYVPSPLMRAALLELCEVAPRALAFDELVARADARLKGPAGDESRNANHLASETRDLWLSIDGVDLHDYQAPFATAFGERPVACPFARLQASRGEPITNRWHQEVVLREALVKDVLIRTDGTRTCHEIAHDMSEDEELVAASLRLLAKSALLVG
jgi:SAM-dependent methyltransferase